MPYQDSGRFDDILLLQRIVAADAVSKGDLRISRPVSPAPQTALQITESGIFLDSHERAQGCGERPQQLHRFLQPP